MPGTEPTRTSFLAATLIRRLTADTAEVVYSFLDARPDTVGKAIKMLGLAQICEATGINSDLATEGAAATLRRLRDAGTSYSPMSFDPVMAANILAQGREVVAMVGPVVTSDYVFP